MTERFSQTHVHSASVTTYNFSTEKHYFKLLQTLYYSDIISQAILSDQIPPGMLRQARKLYAFIKPAVPNPSILENVAATTQTWLHSNLSILDRYYRQTLQHLSSNLPPFYQVSLEKAISYGISRCKKKLKDTTITRLTHLVRSSVTSPLASSLGTASSPGLPPPGRDCSVGSPTAQNISNTDPHHLAPHSTREEHLSFVL